MRNNLNVDMHTINNQHNNYNPVNSTELSVWLFFTDSD